MMAPFFVWQNRVLKKIYPENVMGLFTTRNYTRIILSDGSEHMVRSTLSGALQKLPPDMFIKINRSFAASIYHIDDIAKDHLVIGNQAIRIAKQYYSSVIAQLNIIE